MNLETEFRRLLTEGRLDLPFPGCGDTPRRHRSLSDIARANLALGRLAEAHTDAVAILHEAGARVHKGALYGVWASEIHGRSTRLTGSATSRRISGVKMFCSGAGIVDRALVTVSEPAQLLVDVDLRAEASHVACDESEWITSAFADVKTATVTFIDTPLSDDSIIGAPGWYLSRPGFWHGACGPASCWAGGAQGLIDYSMARIRESNPHGLAHVGAMYATAWELNTILDQAGREIDSNPEHFGSAVTRALALRHLVEAACSDVLVRFGRAFGPGPLAFDKAVSKRCQELTLYLRQSHAECDLERLGRSCRKQ